MQCLLATLCTPFSIHSSNETKPWASCLKLFIRIARDLPGEIPNWDACFSGYSLLPWWAVATHQHGLRNLSHTLIILTNDTATSLANSQKSLDSLVKVVFNYIMALDYILAEQRGVCALANNLVVHILTLLLRLKLALKGFANKLLGYSIL